MEEEIEIDDNTFNENIAKLEKTNQSEGTKDIEELLDFFMSVKPNVSKIKGTIMSVLSKLKQNEPNPRIVEKAESLYRKWQDALKCEKQRKARKVSHGLAVQLLQRTETTPSSSSFNRKIIENASTVDQLLKNRQADALYYGINQDELLSDLSQLSDYFKKAVIAYFQGQQIDEFRKAILQTLNSSSRKSELRYAAELIAQISRVPKCNIYQLLQDSAFLSAMIKQLTSKHDEAIVIYFLTFLINSFADAESAKNVSFVKAYSSQVQFRYRQVQKALC
jgi:hypothetical protein